MQTRISFTIDDTQWPKLLIVGEMVGTRGTRVCFDQKALYDVAYSQFENLVHNQLRPAVQQLIDRRKESM